MALRSTPFSPWMPRPSSISLSASVKPDFSAPGRGAAAQRHAHRAELRGRLARGGGDLRQRQPQGRGRARDLVHQHGAGDAPPTFARRVPAQRHVVGDDGDLHRDASARASSAARPKFNRSPVVLDDQQGPVGPGRGADGRQHRIGGRRGEYLAADRRAQHAGADIAGVRRLVTGATAGNHGHGPPLRRRQIAAHQHMLIAQDGRPRRLPRRASSISRTSPDGSLMSFFIVGPPQNEKALAKEP